jgi:hypothetical protein
MEICKGAGISFGGILLLKTTVSDRLNRGIVTQLSEILAPMVEAEGVAIAN